MYDALEDAARDMGLLRLYVEASEPAKRFFLRRGFEMGERREFLLGTVLIHNYAMEKAL